MLEAKRREMSKQAMREETERLVKGSPRVILAAYLVPR